MNKVLSIEKTSYGERDFIKVVPESGDTIITYELLMITGNKIPGFLEVSRRQNNDEISLLYDITDKQALSEIVKKRKLTKQEIKKLIETIANAESGGRAYQLANNGTVINPDYIFISKKNSEISLMYLPFYEDDGGAEDAAELLKNLIMNGQVENSNDGFIGSLIDVINREDFSYAALREFIKKRPSAPAEIRTKTVPKESTSQRAAELYKPTEPRRISTPSPSVPSRKETPSAFIPESNADSDKTKKKGAQSKKTIFILAAAAAVIIIAALYASGAFIVDGKLKTEYLGAAVMGCGAVLFILYRELFVNNKDKKKDSGEKTTPKKAPPINVKSAPIAVVKTPSAAGGQEKPILQQKPNNEISKPLRKKEAAPKAAIPEKPAPPMKKERPYTPPRSYDRDDDSDDTVIMGDDREGGAYLEYFDNGIPSKFYINGEGILVGKQKSRVNYSIRENTVSKIHAEFGIDSEGYYVRDNSSTNGTYINDGARLVPNKNYYIADGDIIRLANVELAFHC